MNFKRGNLLEADAEALVNTVNTVGVMGKGIALMFKDAYPENFREYATACKKGQVRTGKMFVTQLPARLDSGPRWIINFPTKEHWRGRTRMEWITEGLRDLRRVILEKEIRSIALPPLGCGAGGLRWPEVRAAIVKELGNLEGVDIVVYEPTAKYHNVGKHKGVQKLTPARALIAELVRRYWVLGMECSILEVQKLAWFLERVIENASLPNPLDLRFKADRYGPYADRLTHLLDSLDGSYLHSERRLADARPIDAIWFEMSKRAVVEAYLKGGEAKQYREALDKTEEIVDGFQSPFGMELLATVDWLMTREGVEPTVGAIRAGLQHWPGGARASARKSGMFDDRMLKLALDRLRPLNEQPTPRATEPH
jgi:O-acetyl-ADP-ribose deacetylase (regulator of RNase III)